jgi:hypothetical protein
VLLSGSGNCAGPGTLFWSGNYGSSRDDYLSKSRSCWISSSSMS